MECVRFPPEYGKRRPPSNSTMHEPTHPESDPSTFFPAKVVGGTSPEFLQPYAEFHFNVAVIILVVKTTMMHACRLRKNKRTSSWAKILGGNDFINVTTGCWTLCPYWEINKFWQLFWLFLKCWLFISKLTSAPKVASYLKSLISRSVKITQFPIQ